MNRKADVGDGAFAEPRYEEIADGGRNRENCDEQEQVLEPAANRRRAPRAVPEPFVDDQLECVGYARRGRRGDQQRYAGRGDMPRILRSEAQIIRRLRSERPLGRLGAEAMSAP